MEKNLYGKKMYMNSGEEERNRVKQTVERRCYYIKLTTKHIYVHVLARASNLM